MYALKSECLFDGSNVFVYVKYISAFVESETQRAYYLIKTPMMHGNEAYIAYFDQEAQ